jgi:rRNA maturation endonuclease Nob1
MTNEERKLGLELPEVMVKVILPRIKKDILRCKKCNSSQVYTTSTERICRHCGYREKREVTQ